MTYLDALAYQQWWMNFYLVLAIILAAALIVLAYSLVSWWFGERLDGIAARIAARKAARR